MRKTNLCRHKWRGL